MTRMRCWKKIGSLPPGASPSRRTQQSPLLRAVCENLNFEQLASRFQFSNPVIAQTEVEKAGSLMERILSARLRNDT